MVGCCIVPPSAALQLLSPVYVFSFLPLLHLFFFLHPALFCVCGRFVQVCGKRCRFESFVLLFSFREGKKERRNIGESYTLTCTHYFTLESAPPLSGLKYRMHEDLRRLRRKVEASLPFSPHNLA